MQVIGWLAEYDLNLPALDGRPCERCGRVPATRIFNRKLKNGKIEIVTDRSTRMDCDASNNGERSRLVTYCEACWYKEVLGEDD